MRLTYLTMPRIIHLCIASCMLLSGGQLLSQDLQSILAGSNTQLSEAQLLALNNFSIEIDTVAVHTGTVGTTDLSGFSTYRIYLNTNSPLDELGALYGQGDTPFYLSTTGTFYQHPLGGPTPTNTSPMLFDFFPEIVYDSWLTIGLDQAPNTDLGESDVSLISSGNQDWTTSFELGGLLAMSDNTGGILYCLPGATNTIAGADNQILITQITTDGEFNGTIQTQIYLEGDLSLIHI